MNFRIKIVSIKLGGTLVTAVFPIDKKRKNSVTSIFTKAA